MGDSPKRLWDKGQPLDALVHRFTVGDDPQLDRLLAAHDCVGSAAHARTLHRAGLLNDDELRSLLVALKEIYADALAGRFDIPAELEDCHTAIEARLTQRCGVAGEKIHTGRSRNDQVATAMRLYMRAQALDWLSLLADFTATALRRIEQDGDVPLPGYTHMQPAMPSSVGQWLHAHVEAALEQMRAALDLLDRLDACPLGTGAGFGVPLPLDREFTAKLLGFSRVQRSPIDVQNSRGRMERYFVRVAADIGALVEKTGWDLLLFTAPEYGFFALPASLTTGSSIMPQKRNPDVLELLRARGAAVRGRLAELEWVAAKLPSSYHRDLQLTKAPVFRAAADAVDLLQVGERVLALLELRRDAAAQAMRPELYATLAAYRLVRQGVPFRQAYRQIAQELSEGRFTPPTPQEAYEQPERIDASLLSALRGELDSVRARAKQFANRIAAAERNAFSPPA